MNIINFVGGMDLFQRYQGMKIVGAGGTDLSCVGYLASCSLITHPCVKL